MEPLYSDELRKRKTILQGEISSAMNRFRKETGLKIIKVNYEQEESEYQELGEHPIDPKKIYIKLEDI